MKSTGRLTAELLVRKGGALPTGTQNITNISGKIRNGGSAPINGQGETSPDRSVQNELAHKRVAMTLRLDAKRHLKLRVLAALQGRSCQNLLIEALDSYLDQQSAELDPHLLRCLDVQNND